ncbi:hypothetical protein ABKA04_005094 [Annulohypoxylon sp. FPYF3050]
MAPYDSDSSAGEEEEFTETNVLLGYASKDPGDETISRLGGRPEWLDEANPPSAALARCKISPGSATVNVAAKATKEEKPKPKEEAPKPQPPSNLGETLFGAKTLGSSSGSANPFSTAASSSSSSNPFASSSNPFSSPSASAKEIKPEPEPESASPPPTTTTATTTEDAIKALPKTFAETLSINNPQSQTPSTPPEPWPAASEQPPPYPISYLSEADYETLDPTPAPVPQNTRMDVDSETPNGKGGKEDKEVFESTMDTTFQKFADRLEQNPEQAIRYEFGGQPLLYSKTDAVGRMLHVPAPGAGNGNGVTTTGGGGMPRCANCGGKRTFEVQLTPHAIAELEAEELSLEGMDWGTIIVGVCERDCQARGVVEGQVGYVEEWAGVQWEELTSASGRRQ